MSETDTLSWRPSRGVIERVVITGTLVLETPASFSNGDAEGYTEVALNRDALTGQPLLTGASLAGALRNVLREIERGFGWEEDRSAGRGARTYAERLFGYLDDSDPRRRASVQSWLIIDDAIGAAAGVEIRDGVAITPATRTAEDHKKYTMELLAAGTTFPLRFELALTKTGLADEHLLEALVAALQALGSGEVGLGGRKRRGLGQCRVTDWQTTRYDLRTPSGLVAWVNDSAEATAGLPEGQLPGKDQRRDAEFTVSAQFALDGSLLIRSATGKPNAPDLTHLHSFRQGGAVPVLSGTSLGGVIRARALRIAKTVLGDVAGADFVDGMFGRRLEDNDDVPTGSRVLVRETEVVGGTRDLVQSRVTIDRFTGGAYPTGLFSEQPVWSTGEKSAALSVELRLRRPVDASISEHRAQVGLLLLVLKDLWLGDLALGGESSIGRGRLKGKTAVCRLGSTEWSLAVNAAGGLQVSGASAQDLNTFVEDFQRMAQPEGRA